MAHRCRFFCDGIFRHRALEPYDYYWRLDTDSFVLNDIECARPHARTHALTLARRQTRARTHARTQTDTRTHARTQTRARTHARMSRVFAHARVRTSPCTRARAVSSLVSVQL